MKYKILFFKIPLIFIYQTVIGQSLPMYSQYMYNMININPAYAGTRSQQNFTAIFREQWVGLTGSPKTTSFSYDFATKDRKSGIGMQLFDDRYVNNIRRTGLNFMYNLKVRIADNGILAGGLKFGLYNDVKNLTSFYQGAITETGSDPAIASNLNKIVPLAGAGLYYYTNKFYLGASVPDVIYFSNVTNYTSDNSLYQVYNKHYFISSGYSFDVNEDVNIKPSFLIKGVSGARIEYDLNTNVWLKNIIGLGVSYRISQSMVAMAEIQANPQFRIGYAYDMSFNFPNSHELFLRYEFGRLFPKLNTYKID